MPYLNKIDSGKTIVLATIVEQLDLETTEDTILLYMSCGSSQRGAAEKKISAETVCNTLLYLLYNRATQDKDNIKLLEDCNKVFAIPEEKEKARSSAIFGSTKTEQLPEFADAFLAIAAYLGVHVVVALDDIDRLDADDQQVLSTKINVVLSPSKNHPPETCSIKWLVGCRSVPKLYTLVQTQKSRLWTIDVGNYNDNDMRKHLEDALQDIPGLTEDEKREATRVILEKAGPRFAYISAIAVPFMREPFRRPLSDRLQSLPQGMDSVYHGALRKMATNYVDLLRTALLWSLLAPVPLRLSEIMDAYHGTYMSRGPETEKEARALADASFPKASILEMEQLQDARGPFLRLELEAKSGDYLIHLQDPPQIRDFCFSEDSARLQGINGEAQMCVHCTPAKSVVSTLKVSPKEDHLKLAIECMKAMNNAIFLKRATSTGKNPLWTETTPVIDEQAVQVPLAMRLGPKEIERILEEKAAETPRDDDEGNVEEGLTIEIDKEEELDEAMPPEDNNEGNLEEEIEEMAMVPMYEILELQPIVMRQVQVMKIPGIPSGDTDLPDGIVDLDHMADDESLDDEDRGEPSSASVADQDEIRKGTVNPNLRTYRYEIEYWPYHILQAEGLWSSLERLENNAWTDLFEELDDWVTQNTAWFRQWQLSDRTISTYEGQLEPLHVAAYLGLTSWATHLLTNGAQINETPDGVAETPLQVAADTLNSLEMLRLLLENGANPNVGTKSSMPACKLSSAVSRCMVP
jgi:hypothetical protein